MTTPKPSSAPWGYEYSPYTVCSQSSSLGVGSEIPAYEIFAAEATGREA